MKGILTGLGRAVVVLTVVALAAFGLPVLPTPTPALPAAAQVADEPTGEDTLPPVVAEPIPDEAREPAPVDIDLNSVANPVEVAPDPGAGKTVAALMGDEIPLLEEGGPDFDVYAPEDGVGAHFVVLYPEVVNELNADGQWVDLPTTFRRFGDGWSIEGETFSVIFPGTLATESPITHNTEAGSISQVPIGVVPSPGELLPDGSLIYRDVLPSTDAVFEVAPGGFKETLVLRDPSAPTTIDWTLVVEGYELTTADDGSIQLVDETGAVLQMPPASILDASRPVKTSTAPYGLSDPGDGTITMSLALDPAFAAVATYPIEIDPATATPYVLNDTYVSQASPTSSFGANTPLITGPGFSGTKRYRAFLRFSGAWQASAPLVYSAQLKIKNSTQSSTTDQLQIHRATWDWNNAMTWNSMMNQTNEGVANLPNIAGATGPTNGWWTVELAKLYQAYAYGTYPDHGFRIASGSAKKFHSSEASGTTNDPYMVVSYNDLPNRASIDGPADTAVLESPSGVTLAIDRIPNDANGDEVLVRYQVTSTQGDWTGAKDSGWTDATTFDVPPDWLSGAGPFFWRVQSADVCSQPVDLCPNTGGDDVPVAWPATSERSFTIDQRGWGEDPRFATWSQDLGSAMTMDVNEANGNLYVRIPLDRIPTPGGALSVGLSYNSQADEEGIDRGLGPGWRLWAGPESSGQNLPIELQVLNPAPYSGVRITYRSGRREIYGWRGGRTYSMIGAGSGVLHENADGTWVLRSADGDVFTFDQDERIDDVRPVSSKPSLAGNQIAFSYGFTNGNLTSVTDAIGREARFNWTTIAGAQRLDTIELWANTTHTFDLNYAGGTLSAVTNPEGETVTITDGANCGGGLLSEIRNGEQSADATPGWRMSYVHTGPANKPQYTLCRVQDLWPPQAPGGTKRWTLAYGSGGWDGRTSLTTTITDPRGVASGTTGDYVTTVDFNSAGLPIRIIAPKLAAADQDWITTMVFDATGNMVCSRSPQANALAGGQSKCQGSTTTDEFNTEYTYDTTAPFRLLTRTDPAPATGAPRVSTTYAYDAGPSFEGLWAEIYPGPSLGGIPKAEELWASLNQDWGTGAPGGLSSADNFSVRLTGYLKITGSVKNVTFQLTHDDGVSFVVDDKVLLNCFGQQISAVNCDQGTVKKKLTPGLHPVTIEYQDKTGSAKLAVKWDLSGGTTFSFIPTANLVPNLGLMTSTLRDPTGGGNALALQTVWGYGGDDAKARRLPTFRTVSDLDPAYTGADDSVRTEWTYDEFGRVLTTTRFADQPAFASTTTRVYTDDATGRTSCLTELTDPEGAVTRFTCNRWGDITEVRQEIREVAPGGLTLQVAQDRVTSTVYDAVGRPTSVDHPDAGETTYDYDRAGRTTEVRELLETTPVWATTTTVYDDQGAAPTITETLPDPDGGGPLSAPVIVHTLDWVGNEVARVDALGKTWTTAYDAQNRVITTTTPDPDGATTTLSPLVTSTTYSVNPFRTTVTDPANVDVTSDLDILGRVVSSQRRTLAPTLTTHDALGAPIRTEVSQSGTVYSWVEQTANAFGKVYSKRTPWKNGADVVSLTTTYTYNAAGRRSIIDGPSPKNDVRELTYDLAGRLVTSTYYKGPQVGYTTFVKYNDAGERLQIRSQLDDAGTEFQTRRWTYTAGGLVKTSTELHDGGVAATTTNTYDAGGRLRTVVDPRPGCVITTTPDRLGRVLTQTGNASCPGSLAFTYLADGSIDTATDTVSAVTYDLDHDATGRITTVKKGGATQTTFTYNAKGQLQSVASPAGTTSYTYVTGAVPERGMLETVDDPLFSSGVSTYAYDAAGRIATRTDSQSGAGIVWTRTYEPQTSRVGTQTIYKGATKLGEFILTYDEAGNVATRTERVGTNASDPRNGQTSYTYDAAGRLTSATGPDPSDPVAGTTRTWGWTYDGAGNRTSETTGGVTTTWDLDAQGWPLRSDAGTPGVSTDDTVYGWDLAGNLTSVDAPGTASDQSFTLDAFDRITGANLGGVSVGYTLDAFGRVMSRTQGSATTSFTYEGISEVLATSTTGTTVTSYANTPSGPLGERVGTGTRMLYLRDLHADVVGTVDASSTTPLARAYYSPWGEPTWSTTAPALGFQGQYTDPGTGFVDMTTRNYVPELGRFASQDIVFGGLRHPLSLNQWAYAEGDPLTNTDPLGLGVVKDADPPDGCVSTCASDGIEPSEHGGNPPTSSVAPTVADGPPLGPIGAYLTSTDRTDTFTPVPIANCLTGIAAPDFGEARDGSGFGQGLQTTCLTNDAGWFSSTTVGSSSMCVQTPAFGVGLGGTTQLTTGLGCGSSRVEMGKQQPGDRPDDRPQPPEQQPEWVGGGSPPGCGKACRTAIVSLIIASIYRYICKVQPQGSKEPLDICVW